MDNQQPKRKRYKRVVVAALHINTDEQGNERLNTDKEYYWRVSHYAKRHKKRVNHHLPEVGSVVKASTQYGMRRVVVVGAELVDKKTPEDLEKLDRVMKLRKVYEYFDTPLSPALTEQVDRYLQARAAKMVGNPAN